MILHTDKPVGRVAALNCTPSSVSAWRVRHLRRQLRLQRQPRRQPRLAQGSARRVMTAQAVQQRVAVLVLVTAVFVVGDTATERAPTRSLRNDRFDFFRSTT